MKAVVQRVNRASVISEGTAAGRIEKGFLVLLGVADTDTREDADRLAAKVAGLRIFDDENGKMNLSLSDVGGSVLAVSNFTLYGDASHGFRPSFINAMEPIGANALYERFCGALENKLGKAVEKGVFRTHMKVLLENDGPVTIVIDSNDLRKNHAR